MEEEFSDFESEGPLQFSFEHKSKDYNIYDLRPDNTCEDLIVEISKRLNGVNSQGNSSKEFKYRVECQGATLIGNKKLSEFGLTGGLVFIQVFVHSHAGSRPSKTEIEVDVSSRDIKFRDHKQVNKVFGKCIMFGDKNEYCAKMKCGCLVSPLGMRKIIQWILNKAGMPLIYCPVCDLNKKKYIYWSPNKCLHIADIKDPNKSIIAKVFYDRKEIARGIFKKCPTCLVKNKKAPGVLEYRIHCKECSKDFCFRCTRPWIATGMILCGNRKCPTYEKQRLLTNCGYLTAKVDGEDKNRSIWIRRFPNKIPQYRACPKCLNLMSHSQNCAHMCCTSCGMDFCWICLGDWKDKKHCWTRCSLEDRQKLG